MRHLRPILALLFAAALATACSAAGSGSPGASTGGGGGSNATPTAAASTGGGGGGGGGISAKLTDGSWTSGSAHLEWSGAKSGSFDAPLFPTTTITTGNQTVLSYVDVSAGTSANFAFYSDSFAVSVTNADFTGGGGTTTTCTVQYKSADDHKIEGTFDCPNSPALFLSGGNGTLNIKGSFSATR